MKNFTFFLLLISIFILRLSARETTAEELASMKEGLEEWRELVRTFNTLPRNKAIEELGTGLYKTSIQSIYRLDEREEVRKEIQNALFSIPGHAEYYRNKIYEEDQKFKVRDEEKKKKGEAPSKVYYSTREQSWAFETLSLLPSAETLGVLGEMLLDTSNFFTRDQILPDGSNVGAYLEQRPLFVESMRTLHKMIENPPAPTDFWGEQAEKNIDKWQHWYIQVKEGRRTVRFKGNPQEYDLTGPVREAKNPDIPRATKRPSVEGNAATESSRTSESTHLPWIAGTIITILVGISWVILKKRKAI